MVPYCSGMKKERSKRAAITGADGFAGNRETKPCCCCRERLKKGHTRSSAVAGLTEEEEKRMRKLRGALFSNNFQIFS